MPTPEQAKQALAVKPQTLEVALQTAFQKCSHLVLNPQKLMSVVYSQIKRNPKLSQCNFSSMVVSVLACGELGLYPGHGIHLIPYGNKNNKDGSLDCHVQLDYKGVCQLFYRHPDATKIQAFAVDEADDFSFKYGTNAFINHSPAKVKSGKTIYYYAIAKIKGEESFLVMSADDTRKHGLRYSKNKDRETGDFRSDSLWKTNFDDMSKKTVLLQLSKTMPSVPVEVERALEAERVERTYDDRMDSVFDMPKNEPVVDVEGEEVKTGVEVQQNPSPSAPVSEKPKEEEKPKEPEPEKTEEPKADLSRLFGAEDKIDFVYCEIKSASKKTEKSPVNYEVTDGEIEATIKMWGEIKFKSGDGVKFSELSSSLYRETKQWMAAKAEKTEE